LFDDLDLFSGEAWSTCEVEYLKKLYGHVPNVEIALDLKRTTSAVGAKAHSLGLNAKTYKKHRLSPPVGSSADRLALSFALRRCFRDAV